MCLTAGHQVSPEEDAANEGPPSVASPWSTPGASIPPTPPSSLDSARQRVVNIQEDMRVISDFRALAANSAQGTGIPAGAVWRYDPQKFMRWVDAEKARLDKKRRQVPYNAAGENYEWDLAQTPVIRYQPNVPDGPPTETRVVVPSIYAARHEVSIRKSPRKQVLLSSVPWLSGDSGRGMQLELTNTKGEKAMYWPGQTDIRPDGSFYGGFRDMRRLERTAIEAHRRLAVINGRTSIVRCLESELTETLIV